MAKGYGAMKPTGSTAKCNRYTGTAGGMKNMKIGGGTTYRASDKNALMSGGKGTHTGGRFAQPGHPMKGTKGKGY